MIENTEIVASVDKLIPPETVLKAYQLQADYMVKAGMLPQGYKSGAEVVAVALRAREMGVGFWQAVQGMFPVKGRVGYMGSFLLARVHSILPEAEILIEDSTNEKCKLKYRRNRKEDYQYEEFDFETAKKCHYHESWDNEKKAWKTKVTWNDTKNMLYWRCVTRVINRAFSDVFGAPVYTADELTDIDAEFSTVSDKVNPPYQTEKNTPPVDAEVTIEVEKSKEETPAPISEQSPAVVEVISPEETHTGDKNQDEKDLNIFCEEIKNLSDRLELQEIYQEFKDSHPNKQQLWVRAFNLKRKRTQEIGGKA